MYFNFELEHANYGEFLLAFVPAVVNFVLALYIFLKMPGRQLTNLFILILVASSAWQLSNAALRISANINTAIFWDNILSQLGFFTAPLLLHFALIYTNKIRKAFFRYAVYGCYFVIFLFTTYYAPLNLPESYTFTENWGWVNTRPNSLYAAGLGSFILLQMIAAVILLSGPLFTAKRGTNKRRQLYLMCVPLIIVVVQAMLTEIILPVAFKIQTVPLTPTIMMLFSLGAFVGLTKYYLFQGEESIIKEELLGSISDIVIIFNNKLRITYVNDAGLRQLGYTMDELEGMAVEKIIRTEDDCTKVLDQQLLTPALNHRQIINLKCRLISADESITPVLVKTDVLKQGANTSGFLLLCRNIADIEQANSNILKTENRYRKIIEKSKDAMALIGADGVITYTSPSITNVLGYEASEIVGHNFMDYIHPDSHQLAIEAFEANAIYGEKRETILKTKHKDGHHIWLENVGIDHFSDPDINALVAVFRDVTERVNFERELKRHSAMLQQLFDGSTVGIVMLDTEFRIIDVNPAFEQVFGFSAAEMNKKFITDFIVPEESIYEAHSLTEKTKAQVSSSLVTKRKSKTGQLIDVHIISYPIYVDDEFCGSYRLYIDITQQKTYENELVAKNNELTKINMELDKFVYSASHDIRSPLMSVLGLINLAEDEVNDETAREYFRMIKNKVKKLDEFTLEIIHYSRNTKMETFSEHIKIEELVNEVIESLKYQPGAPNINFRVHIPAGQIIQTDKARLAVILKNLISNAIKYQRPNVSPYIEVAVNASGNNLEILVTDNGEGIAEDKLDKVFDMFTRFSMQSEGSGLGLYIVKEIVNKLQGDIQLNSTQGKGSEFKILLPQLNS